MFPPTHAPTLYPRAAFRVSTGPIKTRGVNLDPDPSYGQSFVLPLGAVPCLGELAAYLRATKHLAVSNSQLPATYRKYVQTSSLR